MVVVAAFLRWVGVLVHPYLDDWLIWAKSEDLCVIAVNRVLSVVTSLGWIVNFSKSNLKPSQVLEFFGARFDTRVGKVLLPEVRTNFPLCDRRILFSGLKLSEILITEVIRRGQSPPCSAVPVDVAVEEASPVSPAEEELGIPIPSSGLLQVAERRQPLSSVSSLEVHFDLLDLTELTDMSDQELAEVFADSDDENAQMEPLGGSHHPLIPRGGYLRSPSWTRTKAEQGREKKPVNDLELQTGIVDSCLTVERAKDD
ncbi:dysbindin domain-containing protein 1 [Rhinatrema bivittatum]|uniref:dysbindin domain-containing protein 1 n=1 Tax=Rhinatrema bivittatum TaxID=194408 RepID=UPI0011295FB4|nr:dysbindin domain-containing protein 1 [Rhinatrema bivittatum]